MYLFIYVCVISSHLLTTGSEAIAQLDIPFRLTHFHAPLSPNVSLHSFNSSSSSSFPSTASIASTPTNPANPSMMSNHSSHPSHPSHPSCDDLPPGGRMDLSPNNILLDSPRKTSNLSTDQIMTELQILVYKSVLAKVRDTGKSLQRSHDFSLCLDGLIER